MERSWAKHRREHLHDGEEESFEEKHFCSNSINPSPIEWFILSLSKVCLIFSKNNYICNTPEAEYILDNLKCKSPEPNS